MVVEVGRTGVAFVEEEILAIIIDLAIGKATQVRTGNQGRDMTMMKGNGHLFLGQNLHNPVLFTQLGNCS